MKGLGDLMKQAQEMQGRMQEMQEELAHLEVVGESGAGLIKVTMNGRHEVRRVDIDASLMSEDKEVLEDLIASPRARTGVASARCLLEDLIAAGINDAVRKATEASQAKMADGLGLPAGMPFPFS